MNLEGRRTSSNVDDRRSLGGGKVAGMGIGGIAVIALITWLLGGNPLSVISQADLGSMITTQTEGNREFTQEEQELAQFASQILASTEDVWTNVFKQMGRTYNPPTMVLFTGAVQSGCGNATSQTGPFYCSADKCLYMSSRNSLPRLEPMAEPVSTIGASAPTEPPKPMVIADAMTLDHVLCPFRRERLDDMA